MFNAYLISTLKHEKKNVFESFKKSEKIKKINSKKKSEKLDFLKDLHNKLRDLLPEKQLKQNCDCQLQESRVSSTMCSNTHIYCGNAHKEDDIK